MSAVASVPASTGGAEDLRTGRSGGEGSSPLAGWGVYLRILLRRFRVQIVAWVLPLWLLVSITAPSYESVPAGSASSCSGRPGPSCWCAPRSWRSC